MSITLRYIIPLISTTTILFGASTALAQPAGAIGDDFIYTVESGDTLIDLSELYTNSPNSWRELQSINAINDPKLLPIGKQLHIPFTLIPVVDITARLTHMKGEVWVNDKLAQPNHPLQAGDVIRTGGNGYVTLLLEDQSTLTLPSNSQLRLKQLNVFKRSRINDTIIELEQGSIETRVAPEKNGVGRFEIHTPLSVTGVRGTNLRVHTSERQNHIELLTGAAHLQSAQLNYAPLDKEYGASLTADGTYQFSPLLPAPQISEAQRGKNGWQLTIEPTNHSVDHYLVSIALDEFGAQVVNRYTASATDRLLPLQSSGPGVHYAFVRAIDNNGLMGLDSSTSFPGQLTLNASDGSPITTRYNSAVLLNEY